MRYAMLRTVLVLFLISSFSLLSFGQQNVEKGNLFIIGGGNRSADLMKTLMNTANLQPDDYIVILPMASPKPAASIRSMKEEFKKYSNNRITGFNFGKDDTGKKKWVDSVAHAGLIYIVGGSQRRFMSIVQRTPLYRAIHQAFNRGATIAGTSAGAAVMSRVMITGQHIEHKAYKGFKSILYNNVRTIEGLGLLPSHTIIDQHFIKRSRFNRLASVLADHPTYQCIGIDESTAIICHGGKAKVVGESQVMVLSDPRGLSMAPGHLVTVKDIHLSLLTAGASFKLR